MEYPPDVPEPASPRKTMIRNPLPAAVGCLAFAAASLTALRTESADGAENAAPDPIRIALAGDSTVADFAKPPADRPELAGWGQLLPEFVDEAVEVLNFARSGTSSKSFRELGLWDRLVESAPDWVLIQFGHNDQPNKGERATDPQPGGDYRENLRRYVSEVRAAGAAPVLVTPPARRTFVDGTLADTLAPYVEAMKSVAAETGTPLVDLHRSSFLLYAQRGERFCASHYASSETDRTHFSREGARMMARLIAEGIEREVPALAGRLQLVPPPPPGLPFDFDLSVVSSGYDGETCWVHPRAGTIPATAPGGAPTVVLTMQKLLLTGSDVFFALNETRSEDLGESWSPHVEHSDSLGRREEPGDVIVAACDFTPKWHAATGKLLGIGHTVRYRGDRVIPNRSRETAYAVYDEATRQWTPWATLEMPDDPKFHSAGAGSVQRFDLENGEILLPIYYKGEEDARYRVTMLRCSFDGETLSYLGHGDEITLAEGRGVYEPSIARFQDRYYLTLRNDEAGYVCVGDDGQRFESIREWRFDDDEPLGNYNTQQHWIARDDALYLVYTRRGAHNDHVFRHRAPLFIAEVDPETLRVKRDTEAVLVPERGARLGNFAICEVSESEVWVTVAEWMQTMPPLHVIPLKNPFGADNRVYAARLRWREAVNREP